LAPKAFNSCAGGRLQRRRRRDGQGWRRRRKRLTA